MSDERYHRERRQQVHNVVNSWAKKAQDRGAPSFPPYSPETNHISRTILAFAGDKQASADLKAVDEGKPPKQKAIMHGDYAAPKERQIKKHRYS